MPIDRVTPRAPMSITLTGVDDGTDLEGLARIARAYGWYVEFGVLLSEKRAGTPRYPSDKRVRELLDMPGLVLSAHLCGGYSDAIMEGDVPDLPVDLARFHRVQINHAQPDVRSARRFLRYSGARSAVLQCRGDAFPDSVPGIVWLFDRSGGQGVAPDAWPPHPGKERYVGFAGGIGPHNVTDVVDAIGAVPHRFCYWLDMESSLRDDADQFSLESCEIVLRSVYGRKHL